MHISIAIPEAMKREVDKLAAELNRTRSWIITHAVECYLERQRELRTRIQDAMARADANPGAMTSHTDVARAFLASLKR